MHTRWRYKRAPQSEIRKRTKSVSVFVRNAYVRECLVCVGVRVVLFAPSLGVRGKESKTLGCCSNRILCLLTHIVPRGANTSAQHKSTSYHVCIFSSQTVVWQLCVVAGHLECPQANIINSDHIATAVYTHTNPHMHTCAQTTRAICLEDCPLVTHIV